MSRHPPPEEIIADARSPLLKLKLRCNRCQKVSGEQFEWACVNPDIEACRAEGWDGISLSRVFRCRHCGAVDEYELAGDSNLLLMAGVLRFIDGEQPERIIVAEPLLWDGSVVRRPSQTLARLRELAAQHPDSAEAHRRLGNGCERYGDLAEAMAAWRRALELDPDELEAAYSLIHYLLQSEETAGEAIALLQRALMAFPKSKYRGEERRKIIAALLGYVRDFVLDGEPLTLMAGWRDGKLDGHPAVRASGVRLRKVLDVWDRVVAFAASRDVLALSVKSAGPEDDGTQLEHLLLETAGEADTVAIEIKPAPGAPRVPRNALCPCGSGKKAKRCCGVRSAPSTPA